MSTELEKALAKFTLENLPAINSQYAQEHGLISKSADKELILREAEETRRKHSSGNFSSMGWDGLD